MELSKSSHSGNAQLQRIFSRLRIRHLELLLALGEKGSLHKASAQMHMTQPAASKLLVDLEDLFGTLLFERSRSGVTPTASGTSLMRQAALLLADLQHAHDELEHIAQGVSGCIRVGVLQVALPILLPRVYTRLRCDYAGLRLSLQEGAMDVLLAALARGELDCVIGRVTHHISPGAFHWAVLYDESVCVTARVLHPLTHRRSITPKTLAQQEWILPSHPAPLRQVWERYFQDQGMLVPMPTVESVSVLANVTLMQDTDMLALMPQSLAHHYAGQNLLTVLGAHLRLALPPVGMATRADTPATPLLATFATVLRATAQEIHRPHPRNR